MLKFKTVKLGILSRIKLSMRYLSRLLYSRIAGYMKKGVTAATAGCIAKEMVSEEGGIV